MSASISRIRDVPDEIWVYIILRLNATERLALAKSCPKFNSLVFEDPDLLRDLDFSRNGHLTSVKDVQEYFGKERTCKLVKKVNIENVVGIQSWQMLNNVIGNARNLVDVNIHGVKFKDLEQLRSFLEPLTNVERLSIDWPEATEYDNVANRRNTLKGPLSRLTYLSAVLRPSKNFRPIMEGCRELAVLRQSEVFLPIIEVCQKLAELRIMAKGSSCDENPLWSPATKILRNLKIVQVRGWNANVRLFEQIVAMLPDPEEWTDFQLVDGVTGPGFHLEKNVQVCEKLRKEILMTTKPHERLFLNNSRFDYRGSANIPELGWTLTSECLLNEVIRVKHQDAPNRFCSLTPEEDLSTIRIPCLLKIDDAKQLLKNPCYEIRYLNLIHSLHPDCDAHLVASAFPRLEKLVLSQITKNNGAASTRRNEEQFARRLGRSESEAPEDRDNEANLASSFEILVENTPNLRELTIYSDRTQQDYERWDLNALYQIPRWKNLKTLILVNVPIEDGKFLIEIGKRCPHLEKLVLNQGHGVQEFADSYRNDLVQMLNDCRNLRYFRIHQGYVDQMCEVLMSLSNNRELRKIRMVTLSGMCDITMFIWAIGTLLQTCPNLMTISLSDNYLPQNITDELKIAIDGIKDQLHRPNFQFQGPNRQLSILHYKDPLRPFFPDLRA